MRNACWCKKYGDLNGPGKEIGPFPHVIYFNVSVTHDKYCKNILYEKVDGYIEFEGNSV